MKTNKSYTKRLKITKNGKILARAPGFNHFNAKQKRTKQLAGKKMSTFPMTSRERRQFLPGLVK